MHKDTCERMHEDTCERMHEDTCERMHEDTCERMHVRVYITRGTCAWEFCETSSSSVELSCRLKVTTVRSAICGETCRYDVQ